MCVLYSLAGVASELIVNLFYEEFFICVIIKLYIFDVTTPVKPRVLK